MWALLSISVAIICLCNIGNFRQMRESAELLDGFDIESEIYSENARRRASYDEYGYYVKEYTNSFGRCLADTLYDEYLPPYDAQPVIRERKTKIGRRMYQMVVEYQNNSGEY